MSYTVYGAGDPWYVVVPIVGGMAAYTGQSVLRAAQALVGDVSHGSGLTEKESLDAARRAAKAIRKMRRLSACIRI